MQWLESRDTMISFKLREIMFLFLSVILPVVLSQEESSEQSISINKPIMRNQQSWVRFSTDYVRCFCNLPSCVSTGYMCKSSGGGCFSDILDHTYRASIYRGRHGCLELLTDSQRSRCQINSENKQKNSTRKREHQRSFLVCCNRDMCNHVDSPQTRNLFNNTLLGDIMDDTDDSRFQQNQPETYLYSDSEVWFRAATIAVPICGAVILFALIALAVKILKSESQNSMDRKLGSAMYIHHMPHQSKDLHEKCYEYFGRQHDNFLRRTYDSANAYYQNDALQSQFQVPLMVESVDLMSNCSAEDKNETNAKLNLMQYGSELDAGKSIILEIEKESMPSCSDVNIVKNLNSIANEEKFSIEKLLMPNLIPLVNKPVIETVNNM